MAGPPPSSRSCTSGQAGLSHADSPALTDFTMARGYLDLSGENGIVNYPAGLGNVGGRVGGGGGTENWR